jgi:hypothetical protein
LQLCIPFVRLIHFSILKALKGMFQYRPAAAD